jgi:hypothetical protein
MIGVSCDLAPQLLRQLRDGDVLARSAWSTPAYDDKRNLIYVTTGDNFPHRQEERREKRPLRRRARTEKFLEIGTGLLVRQRDHALWQSQIFVIPDLPWRFRNWATMIIWWITVLFSSLCLFFSRTMKSTSS